jgi:hypothetical protein
MSGGSSEEVTELGFFLWRERLRHLDLGYFDFFRLNDP